MCFHFRSQFFLLRACSCCNSLCWCVVNLCSDIFVWKENLENIKLQVVRGPVLRSSPWYMCHMFSYLCSLNSKREKRVCIRTRTQTVKFTGIVWFSVSKYWSFWETPRYHQFFFNSLKCTFVLLFPQLNRAFEEIKRTLGHLWSFCLFLDLWEYVLINKKESRIMFPEKKKS